MGFQRIVTGNRYPHLELRRGVLLIPTSVVTEIYHGDLMVAFRISVRKESEYGCTYINMSSFDNKYDRV
jgi:hypothetical protein